MKPSLTVPSYSEEDGEEEEEEEETDKTMVSQAPAVCQLEEGLEGSPGAKAEEVEGSSCWWTSGL